MALCTLGRGFASAPPEAYRCGGSAGLTPASRLSPEPAKARGHRLTIMSSLAKAWGEEKVKGLEAQHLPAAEKVKVEVVDRLPPVFPAIHDEAIAALRDAKLPSQLLRR